jgi:hypothetical protein
VCAISVLPFSGGGRQSEVSTFGEPAQNGISTDVNAVTPDYFMAMGISVNRGGVFTSADTATTPAVAVIDERLAERHWPGSGFARRSAPIAGESSTRF